MVLYEPDEVVAVVPNPPKVGAADVVAVLPKAGAVEVPPKKAIFMFLVGKWLNRRTRAGVR